jgi:hypothetical protein
MSSIIRAADEGVLGASIVVFKTGIVAELPSIVRGELFTCDIDYNTGSIDTSSVRFAEVTVEGETLQAHDVVRYYWHRAIYGLDYVQAAYRGRGPWLC